MAFKRNFFWLLLLIISVFWIKTAAADVDECANKTQNTCHENAQCTNTVGSYTCACNTGYTGNGVKCDDIDECANKTQNTCHENAQCTNTVGSYTCGCNKGYTGNGVKCDDIDECANKTQNTCHEKAQCTNTVGSYTCGCNNGYTGNGVKCDDIDECANKTKNTCHENAQCTNTVGSYTCACNNGYTGNGVKCDDIDECANKTKNTCHENAQCTNTVGSYTCACNNGYTGNGVKCDDIDECANKTQNTCHENAQCMNTVGSYTCACNNGYTGNGVKCDDIDECANKTQNTCHENAQCTNTVGSYTCACNTGYTGNGVKCDDIDECANKTQNTCHENAQCMNTMGSYTCACNNGYTGNGVKCDDIDECANKTQNTCHENAQCMNTVGSYTCGCNNGYTGNGVKCDDIDECANKTKNTCHENAQCTNTVGSYTCACNNGYTGNGVKCDDIDECANKTQNTCHENAQCTNTVGSYTCGCNNGYTGNGVKCDDINECANSNLNNCDQNAFCNNTAGFYNCTCNNGYSGNGTTCTDIDECAKKPCHKDAYCNNTIGSYNCTCHKGYVAHGKVCKGPPVFNRKPENKTVKEGSMNVSFNCNATSFPTPKLAWLKDGKVIKQNSTNFVLSKDMGTLTIRKVRKSDAGLYVCNATNEVKSVAVDAYLNVLFDPDVTLSPTPSQEIQYQKTATFTCIFDGNPAPKISWSFTNTSLLNSANMNLPNSTNNTSTNSTNTPPTNSTKNPVSNSTNSHSSNFTYTPPTNSTKNPVSNSTNGHSPNSTHTSPVNSTNIPVSDSNLHNSTENSLSNHITTLLTNSIKYGINTNGNKSILIVRNLTRNDSGNYTCFAKNSVGIDSETSQLIVLSPPDAPINLTVINKTKNSISIRWRKGLFNGNRPVKSFSVQVIDKNTTKPVFCLISPNKTSTLCTSLNPNWTFVELKIFTTYNFTICSINSIGETCTDGKFSVTTSQDAPGKPRDLTVILTSSSSESLYISWKPPAILNGIITIYELRLCLIRNGNGKDFEPCVSLSNITLPANARNFNASKLCAYCNYRIQLRAKTIKFGEFASATGRTNESVPSQPTNVKLTPLPHHGLQLSWEAPSNKNGDLTGYNITWKIVRNDTNHTVDGDLKTKIVKDDVLSFDIPNPMAYTEYIVTVNAVNGAGNGLMVTKKARTNEHVPSAPTSVKIISVSSSQLNIKWQPPADPNGVITGYYITWRMIKNDLDQSDTNNVFNSTSLSAKTRMYPIQKLAPYSEYNVSINAMTSFGNGSKVYVTSRTNESLPGEPGSVQLIPVSATVLNLTWKSPSDPNGIIIGYRVIWEMIEDDKKNTPKPQNSTVKIINNGSAGSYPIEGLAAYSVYKVSLNAITSIGNGSKVNVTSRTNESLPGEPGSVQLIPVSATVLNLTWKSPSDPNGIIIGYRVIWEMIEDDKKNTPKPQNSTVKIINNGSAGSYPIEGLAAYSVYKVSLNAITSIGNGSKVNVTSRTNESLPGEPGSVQLIPVSATVLNLTWKSPSDPNGIIIGYRVIWEMIEDDKKNISVPQNSRVKVINNGSAVSYPIEGLAAYSVYNVSLNAITSIGNGSKVNVTSRTNESLPGEPGSVQLIPVSAMVLNLTWKSPSDPNGIIIGYRVIWEMIEDDNKNTHVPRNSRVKVINNGSTVSYPIEGLAAYSVYNVSLNAITSIGNGSKVNVTSRTNESLPGEPGSVQLIPVSATVLNLTWESPSDPNGIIIGYRVIWEMIEDDNKNTHVPQNSSVKIINNRSAVSYPIEGLAAYSVYNVSLNAITSIGNGSKVNVTSRTDESLPGEPGSVQLIPVSATVLNLTWKSPSDPNGIIIGYRVIWEMIEDDKKNMSVPQNSRVKIINNGSAVSYQIEGLAAYSVYNVSLNAITSIGNGSKVNVTSRTNESLPGEPGSVQLIPVSATVLNLTWKSPSDPNGIIIGYRVIWEMIEDDNKNTHVPRNSRVKVINNGSAVSYPIEGLAAYSVYNVSLNAITSIGNGSKVNATSRTNESLPGEPGSVQLIPVSATVLNLTWKSPSDPNGIIIGYRVIWEMIEDDKENMSVPENSRVKVINNGSAVSYQIKELEPYSVYNVSLNAITSIGNGSKVNDTSRTNESLPGIPSNLQCGLSASKSLNIIWSQPSNPNGKIRQYSVLWRKIKDKNEEEDVPEGKVRFLKTKYENITEGGLEPFTRYKVSVSARTLEELGYGAADEIQCDTAEDVPSGIPASVEAEHLGPFRARVKWKRIKKLDWQAASINYIVTYTLENGAKPEPHQKVVPSNELEVELSGLFENSTYSVHVLANNTVGDGGRSESVTFRTNSSFHPEEVTENTITITLEKFENENVRIYQIIALQVVKINGEYQELPDITTLEVTRYYHNRTENEPYITAEFGPSEFKKKFIIGDGKSYNARRKRRQAPNDIENGKLESGAEYRFLQRGLNKDRKVIENKKWTPPLFTRKKIGPDDGGPGGGVIAAVVVAVIIVIVLVSVVLVYVRRRNSNGTYYRRNDQEDKGGVNLGYHSGEVIPVANFSEHCRILAADSNYNYSQEYSQIPRKNASHTMHHAQNQENRECNRYNNILCYDVTRVVLETDPEGKDYINASFLQGFEKEKAYIASQGPLENTCEDFWRMVWENFTSTIVMVTGLEEGRKIKCHQYWPSSESMEYGQFVVTLVEEIELTDYTIRKFTLNSRGERQERSIKQFHYTAWPDHGVPSSPSSLLNFVRKSSAANPPNAGPMVVHCSAGVGRTGTYIVIDTQLKRIAKHKTIDVYGNVQALRNQRLMMVQVEDQYIFIHNVLLEAINSGETEIQVEDFPETMKQMMNVNPETGVPRVEEEFQSLGRAVIPPVQFKAANMNCNKQKNRYANVLPYDDSRVKLCLIPGVEGSDYINANFIDGYMKKKAFIATQAPIPDTISDFWRMVWQESSLTIVMLSNEMESGRIKVHRYWPNKAPAVIGDLMVELMGEQKYEEYILREFKLTNTKEKASHVIRQYNYTTWPDVGSPASSAGMIDLIGQVQRWQQQSGNKIITVHCSAGVGRTGVFCALSNLIERLKTEHVIDVFQTVKTLRLKRPAMVQTKEQYEFCYQTIQEYLDSFELYDNFNVG
ncbi:tyrosine-protein phosphatase Lar-like isoform X5 [Dendronephthya gigantea]|uniref:tyrosine-protein phosphatase Lar-like isoform X5 n=1 Tax=Dendronephthya gigantea TaxID=151771 RepID=UPI001069025E|nr:tyrosine-protein phosphatase Lar-like isoform X5 [Dendronephthya gigantea]